MKKISEIKLMLLSFLLVTVGILHSQIIPLTNAYAHNDYWHKRPLLDALEKGFTYMEADIYLKRGKLIVTHILPSIKAKRTLETLYLEPLFKRINSDAQKNRNPFFITLMIDIKSDAEETYAILLPLLEKYKSILSTYENDVFIKRNVTIVITGHKPFESIKTNKCRIAFIDEDLRRIGTDSSLHTYITASCKYSKLLNWKGEGSLPEKERKRLSFFVLQAHALGRKVRLWASPENSVVWQALLNCNVDLINTDRLEELRIFLVSTTALISSKELNNQNTFPEKLPSSIVANNLIGK
jgi:hypothetical protein